MTTVADGLYQFGGQPVGPGGMPLLFGKQSKAFFVDPVNGADGNDGQSPMRALATLYRAHALMTAGQNDVAFLIGNGAASGTARLSLANAIAGKAADAADPTAGTLVWSKAACHLIGIAAPTMVGSRARIAPPSGVYTQATFGSGNFVSVTAQGCHFQNLDVFNGFSTGGVNQICWTDSGGRNSYVGMNFQGMGDAASAADAGSRSLLVTGTTGENTFRECTIGLDTLSRSSGTSEMELAAGSPRNTFKNCNILTFAGAAGCFWLKVATGGIDRWVLFDSCSFMNPIQSTATAMTVGASLAAASGGAVVLRNCLSLGATKFTTTGVAYTNNPASAAGGGLVTPIT